MQREPAASHRQAHKDPRFIPPIVPSSAVISESYFHEELNADALTITRSKAKSAAPDSSNAGLSQEKLEGPISTSSNVCAQEQTCTIKISPPDTSLDTPNDTPAFTFEPKAAISDAVSHIHQNMLNTIVANIIIADLPANSPDLHKDLIEHCCTRQVAISSPVTLATAVIPPPPRPSTPILSAATFHSSSSISVQPPATVSHNPARRILAYKKVADPVKSITAILMSTAHVLSPNKLALALDKSGKGWVRDGYFPPFVPSKSTASHPSSSLQPCPVLSHPLPPLFPNFSRCHPIPQYRKPCRYYHRRRVPKVRCVFPFCFCFS